MWLGIPKYIYDSVNSYGCGQAHLIMPKVISHIKSANVKTEVSYDGGYVGRHPQKSKLIQ